MEHQTTNHEAAPAHHAGHAGHADHAAQFRERFWWSLALSVPVVAFSGHVRRPVGYTRPAGTGWISPLFGIAVFAYGGVPFLKGAAHEIRARQPGMMLLIGLAITVAFIASLATSLHVEQLRSRLLVGARAAHRRHVARPLARDEGDRPSPRRARRARRAVARRSRTRHRSGRRRDGAASTRSGRAMSCSSAAGARVPADGDIVDGEAEVDESMVTGESRPVPKRAGDRVVAGTVSTDSAIRVRVTAVGDDTALAGIQRLVAEAQASRSRAQALADRAAAFLFYVATGSAVVTFVVWMLLGDTNMAVEATVTVLVIACPHALGLGDPARDRDLDRVRPPGPASW